MDNTPQSQTPAPTPSAEPPTTLETLRKLAEASKARRLAPADEERATALLKELLGTGKEGLACALEPLISLPWIVSVNAVSALWAGFKPLARRRLLSDLAKDGSEQAQRLRLSLARAIFKIEPPAGLKLAAAAAADLKEAETGVLPSRSRQIFFNVFIGKGKPWLLQLPLADLKGAEADALVHCALECFSLCPPLSQLSILRWADGAGRFKKLSPADLEVAVKSIARWNIKLQRQLQAEMADLPKAITTVFKTEEKETTERGPSSPPRNRGQESPRPAEAPSSAAVIRENDAEPSASRVPGETQAAPEKPAPPEELIIPRRAGRLERPGPPQPKGRPNPEPRAREHPIEERRDDQREERSRGSREERQRDEKGRKGFDFRESLRGLEAYVAGLRSELEQTRAQLRRGEDEARRGGRGARLPAEAKPSADVEAILAHNAQLETAVEQLRQQLEELANHDEAVAESRLLHTGQSLPEGSAEQLAALLSIKLSESYSTYKAMCTEPLDRVFRFDYRDLLGSVFEVLLKEGVKLDKNL